jgi:Fe-S-cluster-containing dehydrogenase component
MGKVMIIDLALCNGCHNCQVACKDEHCANDWSPIARPQPDTGPFWNKVVHMERPTTTPSASTARTPPVWPPAPATPSTGGATA